MKRVVSLSELVSIRRQLARINKIVVFTNGVFDLLHVGHLSLLEQAKRHGDVLIVGMNTDTSVRKLKGESRPIVPFKDRAKLISSIRFVDYVVGYGEETPLRVIKELRPDVLVKGSDYRLSEIVGSNEVRESGGKVVRVRIVRGWSTSSIVSRLQAPR
jgi:D-beta-D-heptose 7-phosphate kinase/D-beta-D-heptose 1-phosphate adenosyltransferase